MPNLEIKEKESDRRRPNNQPNTSDKRGIEGSESKRRKRRCGSGKVYLPGTKWMRPGYRRNEVNVGVRQINLANALGVGDWEGKNLVEDRSSIIDT